MRAQNPWEFHPDLELDRLVEVTRLLADVRHDALLDYDLAKGDGPWGHGCRVYERSCWALEQAAKNLPWLDCEKWNLYFLLKIGEVPIKFYRGDPDSLTSHRLRQEHPETAQLQIAFAFVKEEEHPVYRLVVETDDAGEVARIALIRARQSDGEHLNLWDIPFRDPSRGLAVIKRQAEGKFEPSKPDVGLRDRESDATKDNEL